MASCSDDKPATHRMSEQPHRLHLTMDSVDQAIATSQSPHQQQSAAGFSSSMI
jgi:hypothetical protein